ncbi:MAG: cupin domain-containing protein [Planctomycetes bacterium]|nr:cupin domain-containing protein [Planctomycetota bacterium]
MSGVPVKRWPEDTPVTRDNVSPAWAKDGFSCELWVDPAGQQWLDFVHSTDEVVLVQEGALEFEIDGKRVMLGPGEGVFIPADALHSVWNRGPTTARWLYGYRAGKH